jgi:hypothetical protein
MGRPQAMADDGIAAEQRLRRAFVAEIEKQTRNGHNIPEATLLVFFAALQAAGILIHVSQKALGCFDVASLEMDAIRWLSASIHDVEIKERCDA